MVSTDPLKMCRANPVISGIFTPICKKKVLRICSPNFWRHVSVYLWVIGPEIRQKSKDIWTSGVRDVLLVSHHFQTSTHSVMSKPKSLYPRLCDCCWEGPSKDLTPMLASKLVDSWSAFSTTLNGTPAICIILTQRIFGSESADAKWRRLQRQIAPKTINGLLNGLVVYPQKGLLGGGWANSKTRILNLAQISSEHDEACETIIEATTWHLSLSLFSSLLPTSFPPFRRPR